MKKKSLKPVFFCIFKPSTYFTMGCRFSIASQGASVSVSLRISRVGEDSDPSPPPPHPMFQSVGEEGTVHQDFQCTIV